MKAAQPSAPSAPAAAPAAPAAAASDKSVVPNLKSFTEKHFSPAPETPAKPATPPSASTPPAATQTPAAAKETVSAAKPEATPAATPAAEADIFAHVAEPEMKTEASKAGWKALKTEATAKVKEAEKKYSEAMAQLETYKKATPADSAEAARLKAELQAAEDRLAILDVQSTQQFTKQYVEPKKKALAEASTLLSDNAIEGAPNLADLMSKPRAEFSKIVSELAAKMPAFDQGSFVASMREAYRLTGEQQGALSKAGELKQQMAQKAAAEARNAFEEGKTEFNTRIPALPIPEGADEERVTQITEFNKAREAALAEAERYAFGKMTEREVAGIATRAASLNLIAHHVLPAVQKENAELRSLNKQMADELSAIKAAKNPGKFTQQQEAAKTGPVAGTSTDPLGLRALSAKTFGGG